MLALKAPLKLSKFVGNSLEKRAPQKQLILQLKHPLIKDSLTQQFPRILKIFKGYDKSNLSNCLKFVDECTKKTNMNKK